MVGSLMYELRTELSMGGGKGVRHKKWGCNPEEWKCCIYVTSTSNFFFHCQYIKVFQFLILTLYTKSQSHHLPWRKIIAIQSLIYPVISDANDNCTDKWHVVYDSAMKERIAT